MSKLIIKKLDTDETLMTMTGGTIADKIFHTYSEVESMDNIGLYSVKNGEETLLKSKINGIISTKDITTLSAETENIPNWNYVLPLKDGTWKCKEWELPSSNVEIH